MERSRFWFMVFCETGTLQISMMGLKHFRVPLKANFETGGVGLRFRLLGGALP